MVEVAYYSRVIKQVIGKLVKCRVDRFLWSPCVGHDEIEQGEVDCAGVTFLVGDGDTAPGIILRGSRSLRRHQ